MIYVAKRGKPDGVYGRRSSIWLFSSRSKLKLPITWCHPIAQKYHNWGDMEASSSNTSLSILRHHFKEPADREYIFGFKHRKIGSRKKPKKFLSPLLFWRFKRDVISKMPDDGFTLTTAQIDEWVKRQVKRRRTAAEVFAELDLKAVHENMLADEKWDWKPSIEEVKAKVLELLEQGEQCRDEYCTNCQCMGFQMEKPLYSDLQIEYDFDSARSKAMLEWIKLLGAAGAFGKD
jgi:hypothetical protein